MAKRKETPDVLTQILGGSPTGFLGDEGLGVAGAKAQPRQEPVAWEYALVTFQDYHGLRPRYKNGRELKDWTSGPLVHDYLEIMGSQGWELTAASAGDRLYGSADNHHLYFKRVQPSE